MERFVAKWNAEELDLSTYGGGLIKNGDILTGEIHQEEFIIQFGDVTVTCAEEDFTDLEVLP